MIDHTSSTRNGKFSVLDERAMIDGT
jgi:hypothetical protein